MLTYTITYFPRTGSPITETGDLGHCLTACGVSPWDRVTGGRGVKHGKSEKSVIETERGIVLIEKTN